MNAVEGSAVRGLGRSLPSCTDSRSLHSASGGMTINKNLKLGISKLRRHRRSRGFDLVPAHPRDVQHHQNVDAQDDHVQLVGMANQLIDFKRNVETAGNDGQPLRPDALPPQAVAFDKTQQGIGDGHAENGGDAGVRHLVGGIQELLRNPVVRADVEEVEDVLSGFFEVDIAPDEPDQDIGRHQRQPSLERLDKRNRPQARPMGVASPDLAFVHGGDTAHP